MNQAAEPPPVRRVARPAPLPPLSGAGERIGGEGAISRRLIGLQALSLKVRKGDHVRQGVSVDETGLSQIATGQQAVIQRGISERNARFFGAEADKLGGRADDLKLGLEREIKELDCQIKEMRRVATIALTLDDKLAAQKRIKALEAQRNQKRRTLFEAGSGGCADHRDRGQTATIRA